VRVERMRELKRVRVCERMRELRKWSSGVLTKF
jgi:hypothetical protein